MLAREVMADALLGASMLRSTIADIRISNDPYEITEIVNDAIDRGWLQPWQLELLNEGIEA